MGRPFHVLRSDVCSLCMASRAVGDGLRRLCLSIDACSLIHIISPPAVSRRALDTHTVRTLRRSETNHIERSPSRKKKDRSPRHLPCAKGRTTFLTAPPSPRPTAGSRRLLGGQTSSARDQRGCGEARRNFGHVSSRLGVALSPPRGEMEQRYRGSPGCCDRAMHRSTERGVDGRGDFRRTL